MIQTLIKRSRSGYINSSKINFKIRKLVETETLHNDKRVNLPKRHSKHNILHTNPKYGPNRAKYVKQKLITERIDNSIVRVGNLNTPFFLTIHRTTRWKTSQYREHSNMISQPGLIYVYSPPGNKGKDILFKCHKIYARIGHNP